MSRLHLAIAAVAGLMLAPLPGLAQISGERSPKQSSHAASQAAIESLENGASIKMSGLEPLWAKAYTFADSREDLAVAISSTWESSGTPPNTSQHKFEYVLARRANRSSTDALVLKFDENGGLVSSFGQSGAKAITLNWDTIAGAAFGERAADGSYKRAYFAGSVTQAGSTNQDMSIVCVDLTTSNSQCSGWPTGSTRILKLDLGGTNDDMARAIAFDPDGYLFVAGVAGVRVYTPPENKVNAVLLKMYALDGGLVSSFGDNQQGWQKYPGPGSLGSSGVEVTSIAMASADTPGGKRVYFGGFSFVNLDGSWRRGYIFSVDPENSTHEYRLVGGNSTGAVETTELTALTVLRNGKVAFAGWTNTDSTDYPGMLMGRVNAVSVQYDPSFCGGQWNCVITSANGSPFWIWKQRVRPSAIAERPGNRDLVISLNNNVYQLLDGTAKPMQTVQEWNRDGTIQYEEMNNNYSAADGTPADAYSAAIEVDDAQVMLAGYQYWGGTTFHVTAARHLNNDYIFADQFGGSHND